MYRDLTDDALKVPDDPADVFGAVIERSDRVCHHCYRRLRRQEAYPWGAGEDHGDLIWYVEYDSPSGLPGDRLGDYYECLDVPARMGRAHATDGPARYCKTCGTMDPHRTPPTRSKEDAVDAAVTLTTTLHELGIDHDWVRLVERVAELKSQPETSGNDFACFRRATADAIRARQD